MSRAAALRGDSGSARGGSRREGEGTDVDSLVPEQSRDLRETAGSDLGGLDDAAFDVVFSSYGALCWLSDLGGWARGVGAVLRPGGRFVCIDFHPFSMVFDEVFTVRYPYFADGEALTVEVKRVGTRPAAMGDAQSPLVQRAMAATACTPPRM